MKESTTTRREFVKSGLCLAAAGLSPLAVFAGKSRKTPNIDPDFSPPYLDLHRSGELQKRAQELWKMMESCNLCPRQCGAARLKGKEGFCHASSKLEISSFGPHHGEELPLRGTGGSGTIFLTNCNLRCVYCINWEINHKGIGRVRSTDYFADTMLKLQKRGCHNINIVTPTHYSPHILLALEKAAGKGLRLPIVYNTSGWERVEVLKKLEGIVDIYLPDFKYGTPQSGDKFSSGAESYTEMTKKALMEMNRQVGVAKPAKDGLMYRGLMVRHLVLPNRVSGSKKIFQWMAANLPKDTLINIMSQYRPVFKASQYPEINRGITVKEYSETLDWAHQAGLTNVRKQIMY